MAFVFKIADTGQFKTGGGRSGPVTIDSVSSETGLTEWREQETAKRKMKIKYREILHMKLNIFNVNFGITGTVYTFYIKPARSITGLIIIHAKTLR